MKLRPWQRRTRDPEQICCGLWTNVKMDGRISQQVSGLWHLIDRVNWMSVAKSMIFFNILRAIASGATSSWAIVFFVLSLRLFSLVYILCTYIIFFVLYCKTYRWFIWSIFLIFFSCLRHRFLDVEINPCLRRYVPVVCRILCSNVRGLYGKLSYLTMASPRNDILLLSEILVSNLRHERCCWSQVLVVLSCAGQESSSPRNGCIHTRWIRSISQIQIWVDLLRNGRF